MLGAGAAGLAAAAAWYLGAFQRQATGSSGMGGMMGGGYSGMTMAAPAGFWGVVAAFLALAIAGLAGVVYYAAFPEIRTGSGAAVPAAVAEAEPQMSWGVLMRTSKPEERKVLEVLASHGGTYLQKFVVKESGLSKLKTHRIVSRFAERGVISVKKSGNTNEVSLAPWLHPGAPEP